jgi:hypothetical protein
MTLETTDQPSFTPVPKPEKKEKKKPKFIKRKSAKKKKRKKKIKYLPISKLKDIAWKVFSRHTRAIRDASSDQLGYSVCYTCGKEKPWSEMQAGHYESRVGSQTFISETNVRCQCSDCNMWKKGNLRVFARNLVRDHGKNILDKLHSMNQKPLKRTHEEWIKIILHYERELKESGIDCPSRPPKMTVD